MERTRAMRGGRWGLAGGLLAVSTALGLWAYVVAGIAAPLGDAVASLDRAAPAEPEGSVRPEVQALAACAIPLESTKEVLASAAPGTAPRGAGHDELAGPSVAASAAHVTFARGEGAASVRSGALAMAPRAIGAGICR